MVIAICKDSTTLQVVSTKITKVVGQVTRRKGGESITAKFPNNIITYHKHMGGVECED